VLYAWEPNTTGRFGIGPGVEFQKDAWEDNLSTGVHGMWWFTPRFGVGGSYTSYNWSDYYPDYCTPYWYTYSQKSYWAYLYYRAATGRRWSTYLGAGVGADNTRWAETPDNDDGFDLPVESKNGEDWWEKWDGTGFEINMTIEYFLSPSVALWGRWGYRHLTYHYSASGFYSAEQSDLDYTPVSFGLTCYLGGKEELEREKTKKE